MHGLPKHCPREYLSPDTCLLIQWPARCGHGSSSALSYVQKEAAKGNALGEDERASLEAALKAVSASAQTAAAEAGAWKVRAETAEEQVSSRADQHPSI